MVRFTVPRMIEEEDADPALGQGAGDDLVVLAERVEAQLLCEPHLVLGRAGRVVPTAWNIGSEFAHGLEVDGLRVIEEPFLAQPRLGDHPAPLRARGDEVELMAGSDELLEHRGAVLVYVQLAEELAVVQLNAEPVALLGCDA